MTTPPEREHSDATMTQAVEATTSNVVRPPSRAPVVLEAMRAAALVLTIGGAIVAPGIIPIPIGYWGFFGLLACTMMVAHERTNRRTGKGGIPWALGVGLAGLAGGVAVTAMGMLSIPWALGAVAIGGLLGWWGAHRDNVGELLIWTPGGDDLRYRDAGGTLANAEAVALITEPLRADQAAVAAAANVVAGLGGLRDVLGWLSRETGADGSVAIEALSEHQRLVVAVAVRAHAALHGPTLPAPPAPLPSAPPV